MKRAMLTSLKMFGEGKIKTDIKLQVLKILKK